MDLLKKIAVINQVILESNSLSEEQMVKRFVEVAVEILGADYGYCFKWDEAANQFQLYYQDPHTPFTSQIPRKDGLTAQAFETNTVLYIPKTDSDPGIRNDAKNFMQGVVVVPIIYQEQKYGVLDVCFYGHHNFTEEEKLLCEFLGNAAAKAITINSLVKSESEARILAENQESRFRSLIENSYDAIVLLDKEGNIMDISRSVKKISGYEALEILNKKLEDFILEEDLKTVWEHLNRTLTDPSEPQTVEFRYTHKDGSIRWMEAIGVNLLDNPTVGAIVVNIRDATERRKSQDLIEHQAMHDALTGLPNRQSFGSRFEQTLVEAKRRGHQLALMFLDMDRFKNINDRLGHSAGDTLLKVAASRITSSLRVEDIAARFGGDEFLILVNEINEPRGAAAVAEKIIRAMEVSVKIGEYTVHPSVSIGIALYPGDGLDLESLKRNADVALYKAKEKGKNTYSFYDHSMDGMQTTERLTLENELRQAIANGQIELYYQPIVSLHRGQILSVEALARWNHPAKGLVMPNDFIPLAEESGIISALSEYLRNLAFSDYKTWRKKNLGSFKVALNISPTTFNDVNFLNDLQKSLDELGMDPKNLEIEITETAAMGDLESTGNILKTLKKMGVSVSIDDFGTGYSSLSYLKRFAFNNIKIDKSFIRGSIINQQDTSITKTIIAIAKNLNLKVIAEGVETEQQLDFLAALNCDAVQGFYIHQPMTSKDLMEWVKQREQKVKPQKRKILSTKLLDTFLNRR